MSEAATQTQMQHAPGSFCWIELATTDGPGAKKFYSELFGWTTHDSPVGPDMVYTMLKLNGKDVGALFQKGETMKDTTRIMNAYHFDAIVIRSDYEGAAEEAAEVSDAPIINAGDGAGQHPTQSLLDIYTIYEKFAKIDGIKIAFVGDLKYGRTVRSLCYLLGKFKDIEVHFVAPDSLQMRQDILDYLKEHGVKYQMHSDIKEIAEIADVFYMTRAQKERMKEGEKFSADGYRITEEMLKKIRDEAIILHPLPRSNDFNEIPEELTDDPRILIFKEAENGLFTRMALLKMIVQ